MKNIVSNTDMGDPNQVLRLLNVKSACNSAVATKFKS